MPHVRGAAFRDDGAIGRLVRAAKRGDWRGGGQVLATLVAVERAHVLPPCDVISWVPADPCRRARRGGHLPERFAMALGDALALPAVELLAPEGRRRPQRGLGRAERRTNVRRAFRPRTGALDALPDGTRVLVVDDVRTTGATLAEAAAALGDRQVAVDTIAIVGVDRTEEHRVGVWIHAPSAEFRLRNRTDRADDPGHVMRKATSLRAPRPP